MGWKIAGLGRLVAEWAFVCPGEGGQLLDSRAFALAEACSGCLEPSKDCW